MMDCLPNSGGPRVVGGDSASMLLQMVLTIFIQDLGFVTFSCTVYLSSKSDILSTSIFSYWGGGGGGGG